MISRTSEFARVYGIDFYSVISRGSQFKVESMMCRLAKPENFIMVSATKQQVAGMRAAEALPLVMEPLSRFYNSPLLVLDFQSLYPSIMIGYNYWYRAFMLCRISADMGIEFLAFQRAWDAFLILGRSISWGQI